MTTCPRGPGSRQHTQHLGLLPALPTPCRGASGKEARRREQARTPCSEAPTVGKHDARSRPTL